VRRQQLSVRFHPHALDRLRQRLPGVKKERLRNQLRRRIPAELRKGARPNESGALKVEVEIGSGIWAVCFPSLMGGWEVITVYREGGVGVEEIAKYETGYVAVDGKFQSLEEVYGVLTAILDELGKWRTNCRVCKTCDKCILWQVNTGRLCGMLSYEDIKDELIKLKGRIEEEWEKEAKAT